MFQILRKPYDIFSFVVDSKVVDRQEKKCRMKTRWSRVLSKNGLPKDTQRKREKNTNCFETCIDNEQRLTRIETRAKDIKFTAAKASKSSKEIERKTKKQKNRIHKNFMIKFVK